MSNIEWFEKPIEKKASEMNAGDIYQCEFGDVGNIVRVVFESCESGGVRGASTKINYHCIGRAESRVMYDLDPIDKATFEVVGRVL